MPTQYQHGAPTQYSHPGQPAGSTGSKNRWGTDVPLDEDTLRELHPTFITTKWFLNWCWTTMIWSFGLTLFFIAPYYLLVYIGRAHLEDWCRPGEEFGVPWNDAQRSTLFLMLVVTAWLLYMGVIAAVVMFIYILAHCGDFLHFIFNFDTCKGMLKAATGGK